MGTLLVNQQAYAGNRQLLPYRPISGGQRPDLMTAQLTGWRNYSDEYQLSIRQEPERAKVVLRGKEKGKHPLSKTKVYAC